MDNKGEKIMDISISAKRKLKDIYKEIIVDEISEELKKQGRDTVEKLENSIRESSEVSDVDKKQNKMIISKLEEILMRMDMLESKEERELQVLANNTKILMVSNMILLVIVILYIIF